MTKKEVNERYFDWLTGLVCTRKQEDDYRQLFGYLHSREFTWLIDMDANRAVDGIELRGRFADEVGIDYRLIRRDLDGPCSVFEMMVGLAVRCEDGIMGDGQEDNTGRWFFVMMDSIGFSRLKGRYWDEEEACVYLDTCLNRNYKSNGEGGFFTVRCDEDMRDLDIWYQLNKYLICAGYWESE